MSNITNFLRGGINIRGLTQDEINEARRVFRDTIQYQAVFIKPHDGGAMTWAYQDKSIGWFYVIWWSVQVYTEGAMALGDNIKETFIHEMTHV